MTEQEVARATASSSGLSAKLVAKLSPHVARWVDGGSAGDWEPVHSRFAKPVGTPDKRPQLVFTRVPCPPTEPAIERWLDLERQLLVPREVPEDGTLVFTRLAVRRRAFAIAAHPRADLAAATERAKRLVNRAGRLQVALGFLDRELAPAWVLYDGDDPVMMGLPQHHLVPTRDPSTSLASFLSRARVKAQAHDVTVD